MNKKLYLGLIAVFLFTSILTAQTDTSSSTMPVITDEMTINPEQNKKWRMGQYKYSAKPKNAWEVGIHLGHLMITGDVDANPFGGFGLGLHLRKALSYTFSIRGDFTFGSTSSMDARPTSFSVLSQERVFDQNGGLNGSLSAYNGASIHRNYKTKYLGFTLEGILNLGNILFHSPNNKWNFYGVAGVGLYSPSVKVDLFDGSNSYNFGSVTSGLDLTSKGDRKEARSRLGDLLDGDYETEGGVENDVFAFGDDKSLILHFDAAIGVARKINERFNIALEHKVIVSDNDLLDSWEYRSNLDETNNLDLIHYTSIHLNINLGNFNKRTEPLYWLNPLDAAFGDIADLKQRPVLDLSDDDNDGIINMLDMELNTPAGSPVDTRGVTLDSDGDNIADYMDSEPFSPPGFPINNTGIAQIPPVKPALSEPDIIKIMNDNCPGCKIATKCGEWFLPMIHFDLDKYNIKPEFYGHLHHVATVLKECPDICVVAQGHTDVRHSDEYNNVLSYNRAKTAVDFLVNTYGISRDRIKIMYGGEGSPIIPDLPEYGGVAEDKQYMNRRVEFRLCKDGDYDMAKPEGPDAGTGERRARGNKSSGY